MITLLTIVNQLANLDAQRHIPDTDRQKFDEKNELEHHYGRYGGLRYSRSLTLVELSNGARKNTISRY